MQSANSLKILYVTPLWSGFGDLLFRGQPEASGMPAFIRPAQRLIELGHQVDFIVALPPEKSEPLNCRAEWLKKSSIRIVPWKVGTQIERLRSALRLNHVTSEAISQCNYNLVYGHGPVGGIGCRAANKRGLPCGGRLYGSFLAKEISTTPLWKIKLRHPLEYLQLSGKKDFLIITDDGSRGDFIYDTINQGRKPATEFRFWRNGVDFTHFVEQPCDHPISRKVLFYPARIAPWKRQHLALDILKKIHVQGQSQVELHFAGHISDPEYWKVLQRSAAELGISGSVKHLVLLTSAELRSKYSQSLAVLSLYKGFNLGNVVLEALTAGGVVLSFNDGSLNSLINDGSNGILVNSVEEAASRLRTLITTQGLRKTLQNAALQTAAQKIDTWDQRVQRET